MQQLGGDERGGNAIFSAYGVHHRTRLQALDGRTSSKGTRHHQWPPTQQSYGSKERVAPGDDGLGSFIWPTWPKLHEFWNCKIGWVGREMLNRNNKTKTRINYLGRIRLDNAWCKRNASMVEWRCKSAPPSLIIAIKMEVRRGWAGALDGDTSSKGHCQHQHPSTQQSNRFIGCVSSVENGCFSH